MQNSFKKFIRKQNKNFKKKVSKKHQLFTNNAIYKVCQLIGVQSEGQEAVEELKKYSYKKIRILKEELEAQQEELREQLAQLTERVDAISDSLLALEKIKEEKLKSDIEQLKNGLFDKDEEWLKVMQHEMVLEREYRESIRQKIKEED